MNKPVISHSIAYTAWSADEPGMTGTNASATKMTARPAKNSSQATS